VNRHIEDEMDRIHRVLNPENRPPAERSRKDLL